MRTLHRWFWTAATVVGLIISFGISAVSSVPPIWTARWIAPPQVSLVEYGVFHFRCTFQLLAAPEQFVIHISADNRYRLFVNGRPVCTGPARGDRLHWTYETLNIAPFLQKGKNVIAAMVWNYGELAPAAQISWQTAFIVQGRGKAEAVVNTPGKWKVFVNPAITPIPPEKFKLNAGYLAGPGDRVNGSVFPWGWTALTFDDSGWQTPRSLGFGTVRGTANAGTPRHLVPRSIPLMKEEQERLQTVARQYGVEVQKRFLAGKKAITIPKQTTAVVLFDQRYLTVAYPELIVSGGKASFIRLTYAEALLDERGQKGNRNEVSKRKMVGVYDIFLPDGGRKRLFRPLWFRTYRYLQLEVRTQNDPLVIHDLYGMATGYPFEQKATFSSDDRQLQTIWETGWRTAQLCAGETFFDCPYYEQLQYIGDTRIQALISLYVSGDDRLMRHAIRQFNDSRTAEGLTRSAWPSRVSRFIPPFSLFWIAMVHDYWMHRDDPAFVESLLPGIQAVLDWHAQYIDESGMLHSVPYWNFVDWTKQWSWNEKRQNGGMPPGAEQGYSSILSLQYAYVLNMAAELFRTFQEPLLAEYYGNMAYAIRNATRRMCWDESRGLLADTPAKISFSQHANLLAVLTNMVGAADEKSFIQRVLDERQLIPCTLYYRFYLFRAMIKAGLGDEYVQRLAPWRAMLKSGLSTFAETREPTRSDCHGWSAHPTYDLLATVAGIMPNKPGFKSVRIEPHLGPLRRVQARVPHPSGNIQVKLERRNKKGVDAEIVLPAGLTGLFVWQGKTKPLSPGKQEFEF